MNRIINLTVIVLIALYNTPVNAQKTISLSPKQNKVLTNSAPWKLNATCTIQVNNQAKSKIKVNVLKNNCTVNGKNLVTGQTTSVTIKNKSSISVTAEPGTQINLMNTGTVELQAVCST